jgi:hypothetical protein
MFAKYSLLLMHCLKIFKAVNYSWSHQQRELYLICLISPLFKALSRTASDEKCQRLATLLSQKRKIKARSSQQQLELI